MSCHAFRNNLRTQKMADFNSDSPIPIPPKASLSSFLNINISHSKLRLRIPKLLAKTIQRRSNNAVGANDNNKKKKIQGKPQMTTPRKLGLKAVFGNKQEQEKPKDNTKLSNKLNDRKVSPFLAFSRKNGFSCTKPQRSNSCSSDITTNKMARYPSRKIEGNDYMRDEVILMGGAMQKEEEENGEVELCKKRILMGGRCKPLNKSGILQYDENGILLPEY